MPVATTESRARFVMEPDGKMRVVATLDALGEVVATVEVRRGVAEVVTITLAGPELLRLVHDSVYLVDAARREKT